MLQGPSRSPAATFGQKRRRRSGPSERDGLPDDATLRGLIHGAAASRFRYVDVGAPVPLHCQNVATQRQTVQNWMQGIRSITRGGRFPRMESEGASARRPVSRVLSRLRGDGHPSKAAGCPTAHAADPRAGQRTSPPTGCPARVAPSYLALHRVELAAFHSGRSRHRHCGAGPRLAADGCCPLPCAAVLGLSSRRRLPDGRATIQPPR